MTYHGIRLSLLCMAAAASACITTHPAHAGDLNLLCFESAGPNEKKVYSVFWLDFQKNIITVGKASGSSKTPDEPAVDGVSRTEPVTVSAEAFTFGIQGSPEKIDRKTGIYTSASGKQERCWKAEVPLPNAKF